MHRNSLGRPSSGASRTAARVGPLCLFVAAASLAAAWHPLTLDPSTAVADSAAAGAALAEPRSLAAIDLDGDGAPDLVAGFADPRGGGWLVRLRANSDAIYPVSPAALARRQAGGWQEEPFLSDALWTRVAVEPDFVVPLNLDLDGQADLAVLGRDDDRLLTLAGDGRGGFAREQVETLPGRVELVTGGQLGIPDDLPDLAIALETATGPELLLLEGAARAAEQRRTRVALPGTPTEIVLGGTDRGGATMTALAIDGSPFRLQIDGAPLGFSRAVEARLEPLPAERWAARPRRVENRDGAAATVRMRLNPDAEPDHVALFSGTDTPLAFAGSAPAATFTVNSTDDLDDGTCNVDHCSLREAILAANAAPGADQISFDLSGTAPFTIAVTGSRLPDITDALTIDATTQPGFVSVPVVGLDGSALASGISMIGLNGTQPAILTVRALNVRNFPGAAIRGSFLTVEGCYLGTDFAGTAAAGNGGGVLVDSFAYQVSVGGLAAGQGNLIAANGSWAIETPVTGAGSENNLIAGNRIGTDATGNLALGGGGVQAGIYCGSICSWGFVSGNQIAGTNGSAALRLAGNNAQVTGNRIGVGLNGLALPNSGTGISASDYSGTIGGSDPAAANLISANGGDGILLTNGGSDNVVRGNLVGLKPDGSTGFGNGGSGIAVTATPGMTQIAANRIGGNTGLGIDLGGDGLTLNDAGDGDGGPNDLQNFPVPALAQTDGSAVRVTGTLNSLPSQSFTLEIFASATCDASGHGEGELRLGAFDVVTDADGNVVFDGQASAAVPAGRAITLTATRAATGATSELSACVTAVGVPSLPIFADGFEQGSTARWSATQG